MSATREPWHSADGMEDVRIRRMRQFVREAEYWHKRAVEESGADSRRADVAKMKHLTLVMVLGDLIRARGHALGPDPDGNPPYLGDMVNPDREELESLTIGTRHLARVKEEARPGTIRSFDPWAEDGSLKYQERL